MPPGKIVPACDPIIGISFSFCNRDIRRFWWVYPSRWCVHAPWRVGDVVLRIREKGDVGGLALLGRAKAVGVGVGLCVPSRRGVRALVGSAGFGVTLWDVR